jgi:high-affinity nickel-transport protein
MRARLDHRQLRTVAMMACAVLGLHALGFLLLLALASHDQQSSAPAGLTVGTGITAYTLGLRHAFDADHIAAIDNTSRKLMTDGTRAVSVGFWFSLGHSTVVFALALLFSLGVEALAGQVGHGGSTLHDVAGLVGPGVSGTFLYVIAALNTAVLVGIVRVFRAMRRGSFDEAELEARLSDRGLMNRVLGRFTRAIRAPWQMYPLGILFGLGFDTATEVALLFLAAGAAGAGLPWYTILCLPVLFAAGMSLLDTIDGALMSFAYGWALSRPLRKLFYNIAITGLSVAVALLTGTIEVAGVLAARLGAHGSVLAWLAQIDMNTLGFAVIGMFVATWVVATAVWRLGRLEERWAGLAEQDASG